MSFAERFFASRPEKVLQNVEIQRPNGEVFTFHFYPLTIRDLSKIQKKHANFVNDPSFDAMADLVIMKVIDDKFEKIFSVGDKFQLMGEGLDTLPKIFEAIFETVPVDEQAKNFEAIHLDTT